MQPISVIINVLTFVCIYIYIYIYICKCQYIQLSCTNVKIYLYQEGLEVTEI